MGKRGSWTVWVAGLVYAFLYAPIFVVIAYSFDDSRLAVAWKGFTLKWYEQLFGDTNLGQAFINSLTVAACAVAISAVMGTLSAVALARYRFAGKKFLKLLTLLPIILPEIALAVAALILFIAMGLNLSLATILVSHIIFCVAYITLIVLARLQGMDPRLEEAAQDLGAPPVVAFFKVTLPLLAPAIISGCLLAFVLSLDDFVITQFTAGVGSTTLPLWIYSSVKFGISPEINALSTLMILGSASIAVLAHLVGTAQKV